jgi:DNA-binding transcriptional LysR family regulator
MELRHMRYFVAAAEELHFGRAAERLGIAPPTLTVQIQEIERTLAARLFTRTKRSVALTPAGEIFLAEAREVLSRFAKA